MRKILFTTLVLLGALTLWGSIWGSWVWLTGLWVGGLWGLANVWCLVRAARCALGQKRRLPLIGWVSLKFLGLYGLLAWILLGLKVSPWGWLVGFTATLVALALSLSIPLFSKPVSFVFPLSVLIWFVCAGSKVFASEGPQAGAPAPAGALGGPGAHPPEIPNLITLLTYGRHGPWVEFLHTWENGIFAFLIVGIVGTVVAWGARALAMKPGRGQMALEGLVEGLDNLVCGVLGRAEGRRYLPFLGTLFLFILSMNLAGLVPGLKSPTSRFEMTFALALCVFAFVQWTGIRRLGPLGYLDHMIGQPRDAVGWVLSPLMLFIHGIGEIVKPVSLALRLFGNIMGEDTLLGVFVVLGALMMAWSHLPIGVPLHLPFIFLAMIFSFVQALVFTSLSMIYIYMMLPHEEV